MSTGQQYPGMVTVAPRSVTVTVTTDPGPVRPGSSGTARTRPARESVKHSTGTGSSSLVPGYCSSEWYKPEQRRYCGLSTASASTARGGRGGGRGSGASRARALSAPAAPAPHRE
eukprot:3162781-Rhodomonas_salina.1